MKNIFYACLLLFSWLAGPAPATAQTIANLNLETWATRNGAEAPANWLNSDDYLHGLLLTLGYVPFVNTGTVTKTTVAHSGSYAASLVTKTLALTGTAFPGVLELGTHLGPDFLGGVPYTSRPAQLQFYYQYTGPATDSATAVVYVTNTVGGQPNPVGSAQTLLLATRGSYALATLPITYTSSATPDSVRIIFLSGNANNVTPNSTLLIDDVSLSGGALATRADASLQDLLTVAPNPSPGGRFVVHSPDKPELAAAPLQVLDALGRVVAKQEAQAAPSGQRELDLSSFSPGIYLLRLDSKQGTIVRQLTVK